MKFPKRKSGIAFFDLDGPLARGMECFSLWLTFLKSKGALSNESLRSISEPLIELSQGKLSYDRGVTNFLERYARSLKGKKVTEIEVLAKEFAKIRLPLHNYAHELVGMMNARCKTVIVTGEPIELAREIAKQLGANDSVGTKIHSKNGFYTGRLAINNAIQKGKRAQLPELFKKYGGHWKYSFAFGDTKADISMLRNATVAVALNPSPDLREHAQKMNWVVADGPAVLNLVRNSLDKIDARYKRMPKSKRKKCLKVIQRRVAKRRF